MIFMGKYTFLFGCQGPFYYVEVTPSSSLRFPEIFGNEWRNVIYFKENDFAQCYGLNSGLQQMGQLGLKLLDRKFSEKHFEASARARKRYQQFVEELNKIDMQGLSNEELLNLFEEHYTVFQLLISFFKYSRPEFFTEIEKELRTLLAQRIAKGRVESCFQLLTTPPDFDEINLEEMAWVDFLQRTKPPTRDDFLTYARQYPFLFFNAKSEQEAIGFLQKRFTEWKRDHLEKIHNHKEKLGRSKKELRLKQEVLLQELNNPTISDIAWLYQQTALDRLRLKVWSGLTFVSLPLIEEIIRRLSIPFDDFWDTYGLEDIQRGLRKNKLLPISEVYQRRRFSLFWLEEQELKFYSGEEARTRAESALPGAFSKMDIQELIGRTASSGKVQGRVCIVNVADLQSLAKDAKKFQKGDILVTQMTQPNMVMLCEKAAAIVTDEGGITSHAAIISRELNIPCLVGTQFATKVLKDGDLVEVDADNGIVRKL